jgi:hypothetical protein
MLLGAGNGYGVSSSSVSQAVDYAIANGADAINMSFGGSLSASYYSTVDQLIAAFRPIWEPVFDRIEAADIVVTVSAGNYAADWAAKPVSPAYYAAEHAVGLAVASTDRWDRRSSFSSYGVYSSGVGVSLAAPGSSVLATAPNNGTVSVSGTSFSAPITAHGDVDHDGRLLPDHRPVGWVRRVAGPLPHRARHIERLPRFQYGHDHKWRVGRGWWFGRITGGYHQHDHQGAVDASDRQRVGLGDHHDDRRGHDDDLYPVGFGSAGDTTAFVDVDTVTIGYHHRQRLPAGRTDHGRQPGGVRIRVPPVSVRHRRRPAGAGGGTAQRQHSGGGRRRPCRRVGEPDGVAGDRPDRRGHPHRGLRVRHRHRCGPG